MSFNFSPKALDNWPLFGKIEIPEAKFGNWDARDDSFGITDCDNNCKSLHYNVVEQQLQLHHGKNVIKEVPFGEYQLAVTKWQSTLVEPSPTCKILVSNFLPTVEFNKTIYNRDRYWHLNKYRQVAANLPEIFVNDYPAPVVATVGILDDFICREIFTFAALTKGGHFCDHENVEILISQDDRGHILRTSNESYGLVFWHSREELEVMVKSHHTK